MWKYSPEYYPGTEVTNWPFNILTAHLKCSNPFKTSIPVYISIKYRSTFFIICILCLYLFYYLYLYICTFFIICILCLYLFYYLYFMFVPFLLSVFYVCTFFIICILCLYLFYYLYFMFVPFLLSVFYVCTYIFYTYIYCYVAIGEHWRRLFWSKVNISENCIFIFSLDFNFFQLSQKHRFWLISLDLTEGFVSNFGQKSL